MILLSNRLFFGTFSIKTTQLIFLYHIASHNINQHHLQKLTLEGDETVLILGVAQLVHQALGLLLGQLLTEVGQQQEQLMGQHGVVVVLVVQLQDLNKVVEATLVLAVLGSLVGGVAVGLAQGLLALLGLTADLGDGLEGGVQVAGTDEVAKVEGVNLAVTLEVVHIEGKVDG